MAFVTLRVGISTLYSEVHPSFPPLPGICLHSMVQVTIRKRPIEDAVITQRKFFKKTARGKVIKGVHPAVPT